MSLDSIRNGRGFFSDYWLGSIMGSRKSRGPRITPAQARSLIWRLVQLWQRVDTVDPLPLTDFREKYVRPLLSDVFGYSILETTEDTRLRLLVKRGDSGATGGILSIVLMLPDHDDIDGREHRNSINKALLDHDLPYGFIITSDVLRLIRRPGDGQKNAFFDLSIATATARDDVDSLLAAWRIMNADCFCPREGGLRGIELFEEESRKYSAAVSEDLKRAVFVSAEMLIRGFLDDLHNRQAIFEVQPTLTELRDAALHCLYRLLFIFYAESRDERLQSHTLYLKSYSLEGLVSRLLTEREGLAPGNRFSHWAQIKALFKIYDQGLPPMPGLANIPPRGGRLFNDKTPEGQFLSKIALSDRVVAKIIMALAATRPRKGVGRERVSFRELAIEQLGSVYEGLLEYEPCIASGTMIEARIQGREYVLAPEELVRLCNQKNLKIKGNAEIISNTSAESLHADYIEDDEEEIDEIEDDADADDESEGNEEENGVKSGAKALLIRRLEKGDFYFVPGKARKASGSYYTRDEIVQYLVKNALGDLVEGKTPQEIESLRVIDPACGSGHFLVGAARFLGRVLHEAYKRESKDDPPPDFYPNRDLSPEVRERWETEGAAWCKRRIVEKCLFGVDLNPTAVQLAQVALWIESLAGDRPLSFFTHHIRCGNSLLGTWLAKFHESPRPDYEVLRGQRGFFERDIDLDIAKALDERLLIDTDLPREVRKDTPEEYEYKAHRFENAEKLVAHARLLFDLRNTAAFLPAIWAEWEHVLSASDLDAYVQGRPWKDDFQRVRDRERFFHWELQFPEVCRSEKKGFDAVLGNPPWEKIKPDRKEFYGRADILIRAYAGGELDARIRELHAANPALEVEFKNYSDAVKTVASCLKAGGDYLHADWDVNGRSTGGDPDLFKFFVERGHLILRRGGRIGFLVPSAVYNNEGCTGLRHLLLDKSTIKAFYGFENRRKIFNIHSSYKFVCLVFEKIADTWADAGPPLDVEFLATFMRHEVEELEKGSPKGVEILIKRSELEKLSPGTLAFLEYRSGRDREVILKMYGLLPGMKRRPLLGDQGEGTWNAKFSCEFHMTNDRDLWTKPDGRLWTPKEVCGLDYPTDVSIPFSEVCSAMAEKGFWPLYEGKHIEQFLMGIKPIERWVNLEAATAKNGRPPLSDRKLVFRDIASNTNERTCIAAILPERSCANNKLPFIVCKNLSPSIAVAVLNSFAFDFALRFRISSTLNFTHLSRVAIPCPKDLGDEVSFISEPGKKIENVTEAEGYWYQLWISNKAVAIAYGLDADDFVHILVQLSSLCPQAARLLFLPHGTCQRVEE